MAAKTVVFGENAKKLRKMRQKDILGTFGFLKQDMTDWQRFVQVRGLATRCSRCSVQDFEGVLIIKSGTIKFVHGCDSSQIPKDAVFVPNAFKFGVELLETARDALRAAALREDEEESNVEESVPTLAMT